MEEEAEAEEGDSVPTEVDQVSKTRGSTRERLNSRLSEGVGIVSGEEEEEASERLEEGEEEEASERSEGEGREVSSSEVQGGL